MEDNNEYEDEYTIMENIKIEIVEDSNAPQSDIEATLQPDLNVDPTAAETIEEFPGRHSISKPRETVVSFNSLAVNDNERNSKFYNLCNGPVKSKQSAPSSSCSISMSSVHFSTEQNNSILVETANNCIVPTITYPLQSPMISSGFISPSQTMSMPHQSQCAETQISSASIRTQIYNEEKRLSTFDSNKEQGNERQSLPPIDRERSLLMKKSASARKNTKNGSVGINLNRQYACNLCSFTFASNIDSNIHKISHQGIRAITCPICCSGYDEDELFVYHMKKMCRRKLLGCRLCNESFSLIRLLNAHIRTVHSNLNCATAIKPDGASKKPMNCSNESVQLAHEMDKSKSLRLGFKMADRAALLIARKLKFQLDRKDDFEEKDPCAFQPHGKGHSIFLEYGEEVSVRVAKETSRRLSSYTSALMPLPDKSEDIQTNEQSSSEYINQYGKDAPNDETFPNTYQQFNCTAEGGAWSQPLVPQQLQTNFQSICTELPLQESNFDSRYTKFYKCKSCEKDFSSEAELSIHSKTHADATWKCEICGKCLQRKISLDDHMRRHLKIFPYTCESCPERFVTRSELNNHRSRNHSDCEFVCAICQKVLQRKESFNNHMKSHDGSRKMFECKQCSKSFTYKCGLTKHAERFHTADTKVHNCQFCVKYFATSEDLRQHVKTHTKPHKCTQCSRKFAASGQLENHIRVHNKDYQFCCTECDKKFVSKQRLNEHFRTHSLAFQYVCNVCDKSFLRETALRRHIVVHGEEKPFVCYFCSKGFAYRAAFTYHIKCHLNDKRFKCRQCGCRFVNRGKLNVHKCSKKNA